MLDGALVALKFLHTIESYQIPMFVAKLDMMKAYDKVDWEFLLAILAKFGFSKPWCEWIKSVSWGLHLQS